MLWSLMAAVTAGCHRAMASAARLQSWGMYLKLEFSWPGDRFDGPYGTESQLYCQVMGEFGPPKFLVCFASL